MSHSESAPNFRLDQIKDASRKVVNMKTARLTAVVPESEDKSYGGTGLHEVVTEFQIVFLIYRPE